MMPDDCPMPPLQPSGVDSGGYLCSVRDLVSDARALVDGARQAAYGDPADHLAKVARVWSVLLDCEVDAAHAALCMAALKLVREANAHGEDNLVDAVGYLEIVGRIVS